MDKPQLLQNLTTKGFPKQVLDAFSKVPREKFVPYQFRGKAYEDTSLPIGHGQTISQPYTIALMLSELGVKRGEKVLEIGSGCGYVLALMSEMVGKKGKVFGMEIVGGLAEKSKENLEDYKNVKVFHKSGFEGFPEKAPFDRIILSAACRSIPEKLMSQLKEGGILVAPQGSRFEQEIVVIQRKTETEFEVLKKLPGFVFVPFVEDDDNKQ